jgi:hypothetical protein
MRRRLIEGERRDEEGRSGKDKEKYRTVIYGGDLKVHVDVQRPWFP